MFKDNKKIQESILNKVRTAGGERAVAQFISSKGKFMPAIELSTKEMEYLKGGARTSSN